MIARHAVKRESDSVHPTDEEVWACLPLLFGRPEFNASERNKRFLSYIVEETLGGRADRIKAYTIALVAFHRSEDFDPMIDPIVRIEASRLRRSLEHYYLTAGRADQVVLAVAHLCAIDAGSGESELKDPFDGAGSYDCRHLTYVAAK